MGKGISEQLEVNVNEIKKGDLSQSVLIIVQIFAIYETFQEQKWSQIKKFNKENEKEIFTFVQCQSESIKNNIVRSSIDGSLMKSGRNIDLIIKELDLKQVRVNELDQELFAK